MPILLGILSVVGRVFLGAAKVTYHAAKFAAKTAVKAAKATSRAIKKGVAYVRHKRNEAYLLERQRKEREARARAVSTEVLVSQEVASPESVPSQVNKMYLD